MICAFTGHRPERLPWGQNEDDARCAALKTLLRRTVREVYDRGFHTFLCGMARGCDQYFAEAVLACRAAGIDAIDSVFADINDEEGLREDTQLAKNLGFDGKTVVHPRQIDVVNSFFTPSPKEIKYALRVLKAVEDGKREGRGAVTLDGGMIDKPIELRALTTIAQAKAAGINIEGMVI